MHLYNQIIEYENFENYKFTTTEFKILEYIRTNINNIEDIGVNDIANSCFCSTASIHRFVNKFGCKGYKQFKTEIIASQTIDNSSYSNFGQQIIASAKYMEQIDVVSFVSKIRSLKGKRVYIYAMGASSVSAKYLGRLLSEYGIDATSYVPYELAGIKETAEAIIFISNSGESRPIIEQAMRYINEGMPVYAITRTNSNLASLIPDNITHNNQFNNNNHQKRESQLNLLLLIERIMHELI